MYRCKNAALNAKVLLTQQIPVMVTAKRVNNAEVSRENTDAEKPHSRGNTATGWPAQITKN